MSETENNSEQIAQITTATRSSLGFFPRFASTLFRNDELAPVRDIFLEKLQDSKLSEKDARAWTDLFLQTTDIHLSRPAANEVRKKLCYPKLLLRHVTGWKS